MRGAVRTVGEADLADLLGLMRGYCDFYEVTPSDAQLEALSRSLLAAPAEGVQLIARDDDGEAVGFATVYWTWQTLSAARCGVMNDLFVVPASRGQSWADRLIEGCAALCRDKGICTLVWQTALDNERAQAVYRRLGAQPSQWLDWSLEVSESDLRAPD